NPKIGKETDQKRSTFCIGSAFARTTESVTACRGWCHGSDLENPNTSPLPPMKSAPPALGFWSLGFGACRQLSPAAPASSTAGGHTAAALKQARLPPLARLESK